MFPITKLGLAWLISIVWILGVPIVVVLERWAAADKCQIWESGGP
jgi:hypothetical protein